MQPSLLRGEVGVGALGELEAPALEGGADRRHVRVAEQEQEDVVEVHVCGERNGDLPTSGTNARKGKIMDGPAPSKQ